MNILVTGFNAWNRSFIPHTLVHYLKERGYNVDGWAWDPQWAKTGIWGWTYSNNFKTWVHGVKDGSDYSACPLSKYDQIIHLGALTSTTDQNVEQMMIQNFDFSLFLLNYCQTNDIIFHYASSAGVYGQMTHFIEDGPLQPQTPYAYSKYMFDRIVRDNMESFKSPVLGFRYFNVYGHNERHKLDQASVVYKWEQSSINEHGINLFEGTYDLGRDFVWVEDICRLHEKMLGSNKSGIINVGTGTETKFGHIAEKFSKLTGSEIYTIKMPELISEHYQKYTCANLENFNDIVGEFNFTTFDEYFDKTFGMV